MIVNNEIKKKWENYTNGIIETPKAHPKNY